MSFNNTVLNQTEIPSLLPFISDKTLALVLPIIAYWVYSFIYYVIDKTEFQFFEKYRLHTPLEVRTRNKVSMGNVVIAVLIQQFIQTLVGFAFLHFEPHDHITNDAAKIAQLSNLFSPILNYIQDTSIRRSILSITYYSILPALHILLAIFVMDSWQYWMHRYFHLNRFLYRHFHSRHHRLYVPYAFGALYNHPLEGLVMDTLGALVSMNVAQLTTRQSIILFTFATLKTVDDHCGYKIPFNLLQIIFPNNAAYHDIHHQAYGIKKNYSQPFFTFWDRIMGSYLGVEDVRQRFRPTRNEKGIIIEPIQDMGSDESSDSSIRDVKSKFEKKHFLNGKGIITSTELAQNLKLRGRKREA